MKIYLQDCKTLTFIRCDSSWGPGIDEALDFISVRRATAYGLTELKDAFQLLQIETDGFQSWATAAIPPLPAIKMVTVPRPVRSDRTTAGNREILPRIRPSQNRRPAGRGVPVLLPTLRLVLSGRLP